MQDEGSGQPVANFETVKSDLTEKLEDARKATGEALHDARDQIADKAAEVASDAKEALLNRVEGGQRDISANLFAFGGALRAASEHLANADHRTVSKFVLEAAGGLERLSSTVKNKPIEEVLQEIRSFGRSNSSALLAGSVLAGLALGRFIKASDSYPDGRLAAGPSNEGNDGRDETGSDHGSLGARGRDQATNSNRTFGVGS